MNRTRYCLYHVMDNVTIVDLDFSRIQVHGTSKLNDAMNRSLENIGRKNIVSGLPKEILEDYFIAANEFIWASQKDTQNDILAYRNLVIYWRHFIVQRKKVVEAYLFYKQHGGGM